MKCSRIARGFGCGSISGFAAEVNPKAGLGFRASAAFCERSNTFSLFPSLEPLLDATVSAPVLLFGRLSPTRRQEFPLSGRRRRTAQADLAELLPSAGIAAHILRALRECRSGFATHGMPNPSINSLFLFSLGWDAVISAYRDTDFRSREPILRRSRQFALSGHFMF
jgi:hypothetical protein